jgi:uncharacterized protein (DUF305 family)
MRKMTLGLVLLLLAACSGDTEYSADDQMFAAMMVPHHEQAIEMSDMALRNSTNPKVLKLAAEIKAAQQPEIDQMNTWITAAMGSHAGHSMGGMLTESELTQLRETTGEGFDRLFLTGMIKHHQGAIEMAAMIVNSANATAAKLGKDIVGSQQVEILIMQDLLTELGN